MLVPESELAPVCTVASARAQRLSRKLARTLFTLNVQLGRIGKSPPNAQSHVVKVFAHTLGLARMDESMSLVVLGQLLDRNLVIQVQQLVSYIINYINNNR